MQEHLEITPHRLALATTYNAIKVVPTVVDSWLLNRSSSKNLVTLGADNLSLLTFILKLARNRASTQRPIYTVIATSGDLRVFTAGYTFLKDWRYNITSIIALEHHTSLCQSKHRYRRLQNSKSLLKANCRH